MLTGRTVPFVGVLCDGRYRSVGHRQAGWRPSNDVPADVEGLTLLAAGRLNRLLFWRARRDRSPIAVFRFCRPVGIAHCCCLLYSGYVRYPASVEPGWFRGKGKPAYASRDGVSGTD